MIKFKYFFRFFICALLISTFSSANARQLYIEIDSADNLGIPVSVLPFSIPEDRSSEKYKVLENVVRNDLRSSGQFKVVGDSETDFSWQSSSSYSKEFWRARRSEYLVVGNISKVKYNQYNVEVKIINIYQKEDTPLVTYVYKNQTPKHFRELAHHISDKIFEKLIGVPGIFSTRIAYITVKEDKWGRIKHSLAISDSDGFNDLSLVTTNYPLMSPTWSPDGKRIAYVSFKGKRSSIKVVELSTGKIRTITSFPGINGAPRFSPSGRKLALVLSKSGYPKLYIADLTTKKIQKLTSGVSIDTEPYWAPDGKSIYFTSNRGGSPQIYNINLQNRQMNRVTFEGRYNATPSITPDGKNLIMMHRTDKGSFNIAVQSLESGKIKMLSQAEQDESPTLAPNGMMVLYGSRQASRYILGAVSLDGQFHMRLPIKEGSVKDPAWSPFFIKNTGS